MATALAEKHEENAIQMSEAVSQLSKPPNLRTESERQASQAQPSSPSRVSDLASALFMRNKSNGKKKNGSSSSGSKKRDAQVQSVEKVKASEEKLLSQPGGAAEAVDPDTGTDPVLDLADELLDQLDAAPGAESTQPEPEPVSDRVSKVPSTVSTSTTDSAVSTTSMESGKTDATARSGSGRKLSNLFSKKNRQQARLEKRDRDMQAQRDAAQREADALKGQDPVEGERQSMMSICRSLNVEMVEMNPDGHCLFAAIAHQLNLQPSRYMKPENKETFQTVRVSVAKQMRANPDDFICFIPSEEGLLTPEQFGEYCDKIENTAEWGGQPEILAVSNAYEVPVIVYQAGTPPLKVGEQWPRKLPLRISYHRKMYGLGEHYNSLRRKPEQMAMPIPMG